MLRRVISDWERLRAPHARGVLRAQIAVLAHLALTCAIYAATYAAVASLLHRCYHASAPRHQLAAGLRSEQVA